MSAATPLGFHARARRYMAQSGREWDPHRMWLEQATPAQRRRLMRKERRSWAAHAIYAWWDEIGTAEAAGWGDDSDERYATLQAENDAAADLDEDWPRIPDAVAELERRFLGDLDGWKPTGLHQPEARRGD